MQITVACFILVFGLIMTMKIHVTDEQRRRVYRAILRYRIASYGRKEVPLISLDDAESYFRTLIRLWDWGAEHILPNEKFELIKNLMDE